MEATNIKITQTPKCVTIEVGNEEETSHINTTYAHSEPDTKYNAMGITPSGSNPPQYKDKATQTKYYSPYYNYYLYPNYPPYLSYPLYPNYPLPEGGSQAMVSIKTESPEHSLVNQEDPVNDPSPSSTRQEFEEEIHSFGTFVHDDLSAYHGDALADQQHSSSPAE
ncbi:hypothetical protein DSO57_1037026 [Entomophthora muscae]|uniref:Uncharacterized protein n=1 Tax=Entomophthora muscae TaxID=34485 RepID=A0ACC2SN06_9FUNG|nr:hypothetical protein DSO57_1037026 [Entomophthora muscae]